MSRHKNAVPSLRMELNMRFPQPITDPRVQKTVDWIREQNKHSKAASMARDLLIAALNGELGGGVQWAMESGNEDELQKQMEAAKAAMANFVVDDI